MDERNKIDNTLYQFDNGVRLLHAVNPVTTDFVFSSIVRAGSCFETPLGVPTGTAHFLEHMLLNPNKKFTSLKAIDRFEFGDRTKPSVYTNASTSHKYLTCFGMCHAEGSERLLTRILTEVAYPSELFGTYLEGERKVILAELSEMHKPDKDNAYMYEKFMIGDELPHFANRIIGTEEDVSSIGVKEFERYRTAMFVPQNVVLAIQSGGELTKPEIAFLEMISRSFASKHEPIAPPEESLSNHYDCRYFHDDREEGVFFSLNYFRRAYRQVHYKEQVLQSITSQLLNKVGYDMLREELGLTYDFGAFKTTYLSFWYPVYGIKCMTMVKNFAPLLDAIHELLFHRLTRMLTSDAGRRWFDSAISRYIFPRTASYEIDYAEEHACTILDDMEIYLADKALPIARALTIGELRDYVDKTILSELPHVWIMSSEKEDGMMRVYRKSNLHTRWSRKR